jgi:hypothetical protein
VVARPTPEPGPPRPRAYGRCASLLSPNPPEVAVLNVIPAVLLGLLTIAALPVWSWSRGWGWAPAGMLAMGLATLVLFSLTVVPE